MRTTRVAIGIALIAAGTAAAIFGARAVVGDRTRAEASLLAAEALRAQEQSNEQTRAERAVTAATRVLPLEAALRAHVDGPTLIDLFDNEDWWKPFRTDFPIVRVVDGDRLVAARGAELGHLADATIAGARRQPVASGVVKSGAQSYLVAAAAIPTAPSGNVILALASPFTPPAPAVAPAEPAGDGTRPVTWGAALALALCGIGLVVTGRKASAPAVPAEVPHEPTSRFGTPARPRAPAHSSAEITAPGVNKARITDGNAVRIPSPQSPVPALATAAAARVVPATAGAVFGRYRLLDRLGEGGMSELFVAEATGVEGFTRNFVLKRLRPELARDKEAVAQFIDEARLQAGLVHSNIVPVFDFGVVNGEYFMTQEYIVGRDLARLVGRYADRHERGLPETMAYYVAHETLQALAYAHEKHDKSGAHMGIVHRDISAGNVMVSLLGEVKLGDFGIVKSNRRVSKTQVGMVKGNANFMSPEQARGQVVDHRSDLFSLGHVLYYCLTGCLLYTGENDLDVLYRAANGITPEDLAALRALPEPAGSILERALAFDPEHRFQSATEFADALAPHTGTGKAATAKLIEQLFGEDLRRQVSAAAVGGAG
ncbi:MAG TPA: serine/threonine-protein kinase [Polyangia bacterium]|nr:serine/threonine-protein kinase [Polyangia bacterium]